MAGLRQLISPIHRIGRSLALLTPGLGLQSIVAAATIGAVASESKTKVRDGLIFNSVCTGDRVEITVEDIGGAKTVVGLKKQ